MALPIRSEAQRRAALAKATQTRRCRAAMLGRLKAGEITFPELLDRASSDAVIGRMKVNTALRGVPGVGPATVTHLMKQVEIADNRTLSGLGPRQRPALLIALYNSAPEQRTRTEYTTPAAPRPPTHAATTPIAHQGPTRPKPRSAITNQPPPPHTRSTAVPTAATALITLLIIGLRRHRRRLNQAQPTRS